MNFVIPLLFLVVAVTVMAGVWYFSSEQRAKRAMRRVPVSNIGDVNDEQRVRVVGQVEVDAPLFAPLSGRACAYWRVLVEEKKSSGKNSYWKKMVDEHEGVDFRLRDATGLALVESTHVNAVLESDAAGGSHFLSDPTPELEAFLAERGHDTKGWFFNKTIRYREGAAEPGEVVAVVGDAKWERDPDASATAGDGYRQAQMPRRLRISAPDDGTPLLLSDKSDVLS